MSRHEIITEIVFDDTFCLSFTEVCQSCHLSETMLIDLIEHGLFGQVDTPYQQVQFNHSMLNRANSAFRLQRDFELNLQGILLVLELLDEMTTMREQLEILKKNVQIE